jgi:hypothetical protein
MFLECLFLDPTCWPSLPGTSRRLRTSSMSCGAKFTEALFLGLTDGGKSPGGNHRNMTHIWDFYGIPMGFLKDFYDLPIWDFYEYRIFFFHMGQLATQSWLNLGLVKPQACLCTLTVVATNWLAGRKTCPRAALMVSRTLFHESIEFHHRNGTIEISHIDSTPNSSGWLWLSRLNDKCDGKYV